MTEVASAKGTDLLVELTADIVAAYVSNHVVPVGDLSSLISDVHSALSNTSSPAPAAAPAEKPKPPVPIKKSIEDDYLICLRKVYPYASYVTVNISSPNTKNLRQLQGASELDGLLGQLKAEQAKLADEHGRYVPVVLKIAPDIDADQIHNIAGALLRHKIDGVIATNTTLDRRAVEGMRHATEAGGLSGAPVFELSNTVIRALKAEVGDALPIIGVGGILAGPDAKAKVAAGAQLVQLYSGLVYRGPALVRECADALRG